MSKFKRAIENLENQIASLSRDVKKTADFAKGWVNAYSSEILGGIYLALCVNTKDPLKRNRVQFYTSFLSDVKTNPEDLPWANPISVLGGFDDSGMSWIPPAGSTIVIAFVGGNRNAPFYLGTIHQVSRGTAPYQWGYEIKEFYDVWEGHRKGYLVGPNDGSQLLPPWTSEQYNAIDSNQFDTFDDDPYAFDKVTYAHISGFKTNGKHGWKADDGDHKCGKRWARLEMYSGRGNILLFKDDHLNPGGQWANPSCTKGNGGDLSKCSTSSGKSTSSSSGASYPGVNDLNKGANPYAKRSEECRLYKGAPTPQNNGCLLPQSGWQLQSLSGQTIFGDDSVEQPYGTPNWELDFNFGSTDKFLGKLGMVSGTGHKITLDDKETSKGVRADGNGITMQTASGIKVSLNDHTNKGSESCIAGDNRGFHVTTTAKNEFHMVDAGNKQCSPTRKAADDQTNQPLAKANKAFIQLRTGYGIEVMMSDSTDQTNTVNQYFKILSPQKSNPDGPHLFVMQESAQSGSGFILLRSGGVIETVSTSHNVEIVGDPKKDFKAHKFISTTGSLVVENDNTFIISKNDFVTEVQNQIFLLAGKDCKDQNGAKVPCICPVVVYDPSRGALVISDHLISSASSKAPPVQLPMVMQNPN